MGRTVSGIDVSKWMREAPQDGERTEKNFVVRYAALATLLKNKRPNTTEMMDFMVS
jgi:hypothetical protein